MQLRIFNWKALIIGEHPRRLLWMMVVRTAVARKYIPTAHFPKPLGPFVESYPSTLLSVNAFCCVRSACRWGIGCTTTFPQRHSFIAPPIRAIFVLRSALIFPAWFGQIGHRSEAEYRFGRLPAYSSILGRLLTCLQAFAIRLAVKAVQFRVLKLERFHATHLRFAPEKFLTTSRRRRHRRGAWLLQGRLQGDRSSSQRPIRPHLAPARRQDHGLPAVHRHRPGRSRCARLADCKVLAVFDFGGQRSAPDTFKRPARLRRAYPPRCRSTRTRRPPIWTGCSRVYAPRGSRGHP